MNFVRLLILLVTLAVPVLAQTPGSVGSTIRKFAVTDLSGQAFDLGPYRAKPTLVAWTSLECPMSRLFQPKLPHLARQFENEVRVVVVDSSPQDSVEALREATAKWELVRIVPDPKGLVAERFSVTRTTEVVLLDGQGVVRYRGAIDDQYGYERSADGGTQTYRKDAPTQRWLEDAIAAVLTKDGVVAQPTTEPLGCALPLRAVESVVGPSVTYYEQIEPLLQENCEACHRKGGSAPFALVGYEQSKAWGAMLAEVTAERRMPPWNADPTIGHFKNARRLTEEQIASLDRWVASGMPAGDPTKARKPKVWPTGWAIGKPDVVYETGDFEVPATGRLPYRYVRVKTAFAEDRWIQSAQFESTGTEVVHHVLVFAEEDRRRGRRGDEDQANDQRPFAPRRDPAALFSELTREQRREVLNAIARTQSRNGIRGDGGLGGYFLSALPGNGPIVFEENEGRFLPKGATLVFQIHYAPNGKAQKSNTSLALRFRDTPPEHAIHVSAAASLNIFIPPHAKNHEVTARFRFPRDASLLSLRPHLHLRGKAFRYTLVKPDGEREVLLNVPDYDFDWQHAYEFATPITVKKGSVLEAVATYDNSSDNPYNPAPSERVMFGLQTEEEMMIGYLEAVWSKSP